ncbi:very-long-chain 3-oxoacyl-CoA reductase-B isoform X2 [Acipenser oxyrinchus oxyrinchus]|uniref:Very-long-chain 3-oxoacyl-CoA reductase-B isoform X2 n=1 Tax=Acipenser oxyrinchus oxyrinchus TaxID=40147 RepID=A0AAD8FVP9_ACIOX|nr:very-long-chain 3-oxoacyl-CoA reductase-B isoform X2 [Acipenser oxyrinchus oxyrinchus]
MTSVPQQQDSNALYSAFAGLGAVMFALYAVKYSWAILRGVRIYILSEIWKVDVSKFGKWAVVTGATSGIGKAYAHELARRGLDVVLISRSLERLNQVACEIEQQHGRSTRVIQADFTDGHRIYQHIEEGLAGLEIGILVNNVGMNYAATLVFLLDVPNPGQMTRIVLPQMIQRKKGLIINISSEAGAHPHPMLTLYSATKGFVNYFSRCLDSEYRGEGITVQCVAPLLVSTNMTWNMGTNALVKRADDFAREALNTAGLSSFTSGCLSHALQARRGKGTESWGETGEGREKSDVHFMTNVYSLSLQHFVIDHLLPGWLRLAAFNVYQTATRKKTEAIFHGTCKQE